MNIPVERALVSIHRRQPVLRSHRHLVAGAASGKLVSPSVGANPSFIPPLTGINCSASSPHSDRHQFRSITAVWLACQRNGVLSSAVPAAMRLNTCPQAAAARRRMPRLHRAQPSSPATKLPPVQAGRATSKPTPDTKRPPYRESWASEIVASLCVERCAAAGRALCRHQLLRQALPPVFHRLLRNLTSVSMWNVCGNKSNKSTLSIS
jgi:hypothetical protein